MSLLLGDISLPKETVTAEGYLVSWFSVVSHVVGIRVPLQMATSHQTWTLEDWFFSDSENLIQKWCGFCIFSKLQPKCFVHVPNPCTERVLQSWALIHWKTMRSILSFSVAYCVSKSISYSQEYSYKWQASKSCRYLHVKSCLYNEYTLKKCMYMAIGNTYFHLYDKYYR